MGILEEISAKVDTLISSSAQLRAEVELLREKVAPALEVYTLRDLAALPGSPSVKTLRNNPHRQPRHGEPDGFKGREKAWKRETVEEWRRKLTRKSWVGKGRP
jgi:hypothetical protein